MRSIFIKVFGERILLRRHCETLKQYGNMKYPLTPIARELGAKCVLSKGGEFEILDVIRKGKLLHKADRWLRKHNIALPEREVISYKEELRIKVFSIGKKILPKRFAVAVKNKLRKKGFTFFSDSV